MRNDKYEDREHSFFKIFKIGPIDLKIVNVHETTDLLNFTLTPTVGLH